jgi:hypothetical protein
MHFQLYRPPCLQQAAECAPRIFAQGRIDPDSADALRTFITKAKANNANLPTELIICLDSGRGDVRAAIRLGTTIRTLSLSTCVEGRYEQQTGDPDFPEAASSRVLSDEPVCTSVCVLALAGGTNRYIGPDARVALRHFVEIDEPPSNAASSLSKQVLINYLDFHGVDPKLLDLAQIAPGADARFLSEEEVLLYRIATHTTQLTSREH